MNIISKEQRIDLFNDLRLVLFNQKIIRNVYSNKYGKFILIKVANYMTQEEKEQFDSFISKIGIKYYEISTLMFFNFESFFENIFGAILAPFFKASSTL